jgi:uncharacterized protein
MKRSEERFCETAIDGLLDSIRSKKSILVAFSGGADSTLVAALARRALGDRALAVTIDSPLLPSGDLDHAARTARDIGIEHVMVRLDELPLPRFRSNPPDRCYLCKRFRLERMKEIAARHGLEAIADGTVASDATEYRPGLKAAAEMGAFSPLLEAGLSKAQARLLSEYLGLPTAARPPSPCLATRVPYGLRLGRRRLQRIDRAEQGLRALLGVDVLRVRDHGEIARIELQVADLGLLADEHNAAQAVQTLTRLGWRFVTLDLAGYRTGSFDDALKPR